MEPINKLAMLYYIQKVFTFPLSKLALWIVKYFSFEAVLHCTTYIVHTLDTPVPNPLRCSKVRNDFKEFEHNFRTYLPHIKDSTKMMSAKVIKI